MNILKLAFQASFVFIFIYVWYYIWILTTWPQYLLLLFALYSIYMCWPLTYYTSQGIPCVGTRIPVLGTTHFLRMFEKGMLRSQEGLIEKYGPTYHEFWGRFPILTTVDTDIIREVFVKRFQTFSRRPTFLTLNKISNSMLVNVNEYDHWKFLRSTISPTFSTGKLRLMISQMNHLAQRLVTHLRHQRNSLDIKEYAGAFTMDVIASTAFGIELDTLNDRNSSFVRMAKKVFGFSMSNIKILLVILMPPLMIVLMLLPPPGLDKSVTDFFESIVEQAIENKKQDSEKKTDFLQLMIDANENDSNKRKMSTTEILANGMIFFVAGYETSATSISFLALNLALNPDKQALLREEVDRVCCGKSVTDEMLQEMDYLDMCVQESLRLYPPAFNPDPEQFIPERFSPEEKAKRDPLAYLPFGTGPRNCIAMRLALMEIKIAIVNIIQHFEFLPAPELEVPIKFSKGFILAPEGGKFWVTLKERK